MRCRRLRTAKLSRHDHAWIHEHGLSPHLWNELPSFRQPHSVHSLSWFTLSCAYHFITRTTVKVNGEWQDLTLSRRWTLNRSSPNLKHVITSGISSSKKFLAQSAQGILSPHIPEIYTQNLWMSTSLFQFFRAPAEKAVGLIFALNTSYDVVLRMEVSFGSEKN